MPLACFRCNQQCINAFETCRRHVPTLWRGVLEIIAKGELVFRGVGGGGKVGILLELWGECDNFVLILRI